MAIPKLPNAAQRVEIHKALTNAASTTVSQLERIYRVHDAGPAAGWPSGDHTSGGGSDTTSTEAAALNPDTDPWALAHEWLTTFWTARRLLAWLDNHAHQAAHPGGTNGPCSYCGTELPYSIADMRPDPRDPSRSLHRTCREKVDRALRTKAHA